MAGVTDWHTRGQDPCDSRGYLWSAEYKAECFNRWQSSRAKAINYVLEQIKSFGMSAEFIWANYLKHDQDRADIVHIKQLMRDLKYKGKGSKWLKS